MSEGWPYLLTGIVVGLAGGFSPGPITTLVIAQSLRYGIREGVKIAVAPILTDAPIAIVAIFVIGRLADAKGALGMIALLGAVFLTYLAYDSFITPPSLTVATEGNELNSLRKGALTNLVNPNPYLFWFTIGAPLVHEASSVNYWFVGMFLVGLYVCLVGAKITFAIVAGQGRVWLKGPAYTYVNRTLGVALILFAIKFTRDGLIYLDLL